MYFTDNIIHVHIFFIYKYGIITYFMINIFENLEY